MTIIIEGGGDTVEIVEEEEVVEVRQPRTAVEEVIVRDDFGNIEIVERVVVEPASVVEREDVTIITKEPEIIVDDRQDTTVVFEEPPRVVLEEVIIDDGYGGFTEVSVPHIQPLP
ncbi:hypothetical protein FOZ62_015848 [Perkinsus olseni]|uniref:Uncharacterized protein n=1 Tax=Perkinsus olseni TaxID=32597 RepID=A0A7J6RRS3_PEROL|nr:hypothetical protein FOZ62_015848 [Perkinsus olseni]